MPGSEGVANTIETVAFIVAGLLVPLSSLHPFPIPRLAVDLRPSQTMKHRQF